jgi:hypothetical protein
MSNPSVNLHELCWYIGLWVLVGLVLFFLLFLFLK